MINATLCYIALGSNLENPAKQLETALSLLKKIPQTIFDKSSSFYLSKPCDDLPHPNYLNAVCRLYTNLSAKDLFFELRQIEYKQGRVRHHLQVEPRTLDLDLLLYGCEMIDTPELIVPHPRMKTRDFVLVPLAELNPDLQLPDGSLVKTLLTKITEKTLLPF